jgi:hypothetical protein
MERLGERHEQHEVGLEENRDREHVAAAKHRVPGTLFPEQREETPHHLVRRAALDEANADDRGKRDERRRSSPPWCQSPARSVRPACTQWLFSFSGVFVVPNSPGSCFASTPVSIAAAISAMNACRRNFVISTTMVASEMPKTTSGHQSVGVAGAVRAKTGGMRPRS